VWSTDWWVDTDTAISRLTTALEADLQNDHEEAEAAAVATEPMSSFAPEQADLEIDRVGPEREPDDAGTEAEPYETPSPACEEILEDARYGSAVAPLARTEIVTDTALYRGDAPPADYVSFNDAAAPDPRTASTAVVADGLCRIIEIESPMLAKRAYDIYLRGCNIRRLGPDLRTSLNRALAKAIKEGRVVSENEPGMTGLIFSTVRLQNAPPVRLRARGPRSFEEIPPGEWCAAAQHVFLADRMTWGSDAHLRAVLELFDLKRLTTQVGTRLRKLLQRCDTN
jgi:hypothetical protein